VLGRAPARATLEELIARSIAVGLPALTAGIAAGLVRLETSDAGFDALEVVTLVTWLVYAAFLVLRYETGWRGRRAAYLALAGFAFVVAVRLGLPITHFA
jgi:ABC-type uncharacterized transport system permease subunit